LELTLFTGAFKTSLTQIYPKKSEMSKIGIAPQEFRKEAISGQLKIGEILI